MWGKEKLTRKSWILVLEITWAIAIIIGLTALVFITLN